MRLQTFVQFLFESGDLACGATQSVYTLNLHPVILDSRAAFFDYGRKINVIAHHLLCQVNTKGRSTTVGGSRCGTVSAWYRYRCCVTVMRAKWRQLRPMRQSVMHEHE
jgi:hypothetical protein